ncbi:S41 family peptidase [Mycobacterium simulans]|nr:S41 family peptidase [Mycobacterium simulans]
MGIWWRVVALICAGALAVGCGGTSSNAPPTNTAAGAVNVKAENVTAIRMLQEAIDNRYSYRDRLGLDWPALFKNAQTDLETASTPQEFAERAAKLLISAKDVHIWLDVAGGQRVGTQLPPRDVNFNKDVLRTIVRDVKRYGACMASGRIADNIGYVLIDSWTQERCGLVDTEFSKVIADMSNSSGLVLDVRPNTGGDEQIARSVAQYFTDGPVIYAKREMRDAHAPSGFTPKEDIVLTPAQGIVAYHKPTVALTGPVNMSSNEAFLLMMRAAGVKLVGEKTLGASGNPQPVDLGNAVTVYLPSWRAYQADGSPLEGVGITPDVEVRTTAEDLKAKDPVIDAAVAVVGG